MTTVTQYKRGKAVTIPDYTGAVPAGKAFHAWNTREDGTGVVYRAGRKITMIEDLHLYPMFIDVNANDEIQDEEESE